MTAVLDLIARTAIVLSMAWLVTAVLRKQPASLRALVWTAAFGGLLAFPVFARVVPAWHLSVWQEAARVEVLERQPATPMHDEPLVREASLAADTSARRSSSMPDVAGSRSASDAASTTDAAPRAPIDWKALALMLSAAISLLLMIRIAASHRRLSRLLAAAEPAGSDWTTLVDALRPERGIRRAVAVRVTDAVNVPAIVGVFRPTLILPADADAWDASLRRAVVLHELAHVARWDALAQLAGQLACAIYWFNPLAWHGARRAAALRERASDDEVIRAGMPGPAYAERLLDLVRGAGAADRHLATVSMARPSRMRERVMAILDPVARREGVTMRKAAAVFIVSSCAVAAIAAAAPEPIESIVLKPASMAVNDVMSPVPPAAPEPASPESPAPPAAAVDIASQPSGLCGGEKAVNTHISLDDSKGGRGLRVKLSAPGCTVDVNSEGRFTFTDDFTDIGTIGDGGFFRVDVTQGGTRRQLEIESRGGTLQRTWRVDGRQAPYDAAARAWFAAFLIDLDRRTAIGIDVRLPHLLRRGGVNAVLDETALMAGDHARNAYYLRLAKTTTLSTADVTRVLQQAAKLTTSDHYANELVHAVASRGVTDPAQRAAITQILDGMESDHYVAESVQVLTATGRPSADEMNFLVRMLPKMKSDHYKTQVLTRVLKGATLTADQQAMLARAAAGVEGDHYASEFLRAIASHGAMAPAVRQSFLDAVRGIEGDHYRTETLSKLLEARDLSERELLGVVELARPMGDHYEAETLRKVVGHGGATARVREAAIAAAEQMSSHYRDEVLRSAGRER